MRLTTRAQPHFGTNRLKEIAYKIEVVDEEGIAQELFQYGISVGTDKIPSSGILSKNPALINGLKIKAGMEHLATQNKTWRSSALKFLDTFLS